MAFFDGTCERRLGESVETMGESSVAEGVGCGEESGQMGGGERGEL